MYIDLGRGFTLTVLLLARFFILILPTFLILCKKYFHYVAYIVLSYVILDFFLSYYIFPTSSLYHTDNKLVFLIGSLLYCAFIIYLMYSVVIGIRKKNFNKAEAISAFVLILALLLIEYIFRVSAYYSGNPDLVWNVFAFPFDQPWLSVLVPMVLLLWIQIKDKPFLKSRIGKKSG